MTDRTPVVRAFFDAERELETCERGLEHSRKIGWQDGIDHYTERLPAAREAYNAAVRAKREQERLSAEYDAWATGELSEISDEAMRYGSARFRERHSVIPARSDRGEG